MNIKSEDSWLLKALLLLTAICISILSHAQTQPGFVQQDIIKVTGITTDAQTWPLPVTQKQVTRSYYDGLGRGIQTVAMQASPAQNDLIAPVAYDALGRQTIGYLPYAGQPTDAMGSYRPNAISTDQPNFYNQTTQHLIPVDANPYSQQVFENSPLQRVLQAGQVGAGFQPGQHYKTVSYRYNESTDGNILVWAWNSTTSTYTTTANYAANTLAVTDGVDEDGIETQVFTDLAGHTILKRQILSPANLDTYYIYNNQGLIALIIPPKAMAIMNLSHNYDPTQTGVVQLTFNYTYDRFDRLIQKMLPGFLKVSIIYDPLNRPVLIQDNNMATNFEWNYIKYDVKGRAVSQGIYTDPNDYTPTQMQTAVNGITGYSTLWYEVKSNTAINNGFYTNNIFPTTGIQPLAYEYYDNYTLNTSLTYAYHNVVGLPGEVGATTAQVKGMPTIVQKSTVGSGMTTTWMIGVIFYDHNLRTIQNQTNNLLYTPGGGRNVPTDFKTVVPDFTGMPTVSMASVQSASATTTKVQTTLTYDQVHRVTAVDQNYNSGPTVHVATYSYNELGKVIMKSLGYVNPTTWLQNVNMRYSIRGQLLYINNSKLANDGGVTSNDSNDLFGMQMLYDQQDAHLDNGAGNTVKYDGRLTAVKWMSTDASGAKSWERSYMYAYDNVARYTAETYSERSVASTTNFNNNLNGFDESGITYDENGNILTLQRNSSTQGLNSHIQIDNLTYTYASPRYNQVSTITDGTGATYTGAGFRNLTGATTAYTYDANGNLIHDYYKGLTNSYNVLNRTDKTTITTGTNQYINYIYDASGNLIRKMAYNGGTLITQTDYIGGFVYVNSALSYFPMPEGRVLYNGTTFTQEYIITDQQGNARISFQNNGSGAAVVTQENSYYGFGLQLLNSPVSLPPVPNKQLYNGGSEWQNDYSNLPDYYQTFYRNYDAAIGRFISADPMAESAQSMTVYQYAGNNPVMMNDPSGNKAIDTYKINGPYWTSSENEAFAEGAASNGQVYSDDNFGQNLGPWSISGGAGGGDYSAFWSNALANLNRLLAGLNDPEQATPNGVDFQSNIAFLAFATTQLDPNQDYNFDVTDGTLSLSLHNADFAEMDHVEAQLTGYSRNDLSAEGGYLTAYNHSTTIGARITIDYTHPLGMPHFESYQWIQMVSSSGDVMAYNYGILVDGPYLDGLRDDSGNLLTPPFGYSSGQLAAWLPHDIPGIQLTSEYTDGPRGDMWFQAETTLVGIDSNGRLTALGSYSWGYALNGAGNSESGPATFSLAPSTDTQKVINNYNNNRR